MANITSEDKTSIQFVLPKKAKEHLENIAKARSTEQQKVYLSDLIREALEAQYNGNVSFEVDRGGNRRGENSE